MLGGKREIRGSQGIKRESSLRMSLSTTTFKIPKMDCPSEEKIVRMALDKSNMVRSLAFNLGERSLTVVHEGESGEILKLLEPLKFGARIADSREMSEAEEAFVELSTGHLIQSASEATVLKQLLAINGFMFFLELFLGIYAGSTGLIADSLDMFADAAVYGLSLFAVGKAIELKRKAARTSGFLQVLLSLGALSEVIRRFIFGSEPEGILMMGVACLALVANATSLILLSRHRDGEVHMKASWIFSTNDVIANAGVIIAGLFVLWTKSNWPDLIAGSVIAVVVLRGGLTILKISAKEKPLSVDPS